MHGCKERPLLKRKSFSNSKRDKRLSAHPSKLRRLRKQLRNKPSWLTEEKYAEVAKILTVMSFHHLRSKWKIT